MWNCNAQSKTKTIVSFIASSEPTESPYMNRFSVWMLFWDQRKTNLAIKNLHSKLQWNLICNFIGEINHFKQFCHFLFFFRSLHLCLFIRIIDDFFRVSSNYCQTYTFVERNFQINLRFVQSWSKFVKVVKKVWHDETEGTTWNGTQDKISLSRTQTFCTWNLGHILLKCMRMCFVCVEEK